MTPSYIFASSMGAGTQKSSGEGTQVLNTVTLHLSRNKKNQGYDYPLSFDSVVKSLQSHSQEYTMPLRRQELPVREVVEIGKRQEERQRWKAHVCKSQCVGH